MKYNVGDVVKIREDLDLLYKERANSDKEVFPIETFFRGYAVDVVSVYPEWEGYGVVYKNSRKFFVHETHIAEV